MTIRAADQPDADAITSAPPIRYDDHGHATPRTEAERAARTEAIRKGLGMLAAIEDDDPPGSDEAFMRAIDAGRPPRPLFEGHYEP